MFGVVLVLATLGWVAAIIRVHQATKGDTAGTQWRLVMSREGHAARRLLAGRIDRAAYRAFMAGLARRDARALRLGSGPRSRA